MPQDETEAQDSEIEAKWLHDEEIARLLESRDADVPVHKW